MTATMDAILASPWLLGVLVVMVAIDGPLPFLPSEPLLLIGAARALADGDVTMLAGLFVATVIGSLLGDQILYALGRTSRRFVPEGDGRVARWVHRHLHRRPVVALTSARLLPGGRLLSVSAAGRTALPRRRFLPASMTSAVLWTTYMTGIGAGVAQLTGGDPVWSIVASLALGAVVAILCTVVGRMRGRLTARMAV